MDLSELLDIGRRRSGVPEFFTDLNELGTKFPVLHSYISPYEEHIQEVSFFQYHSIIGGEDFAMLTTHWVIIDGDHKYRVAIALHETGKWVVSSTLCSGDHILLDKYPGTIGPYSNLTDAMAIGLLCFQRR